MVGARHKLGEPVPKQEPGNSDDTATTNCDDKGSPVKILLTDTAFFDFDHAQDVEVVEFDESQPIPEQHRDADAVVAWGHPASIASLSEMSNLRWVQSLSAGTDAFIAGGLPENVILTNGSGLHDQTVSEHALALVLGLLRDLPGYVRDQDGRVWDEGKRGPRPVKDPSQLNSLIGANVVIWGFGSIGQAMAPIFAALGANVTGVANTAGERSGFPVVTNQDLPAILPNTDVLVMVLPSLPSTQKILGKDLLELLPSRAVICNVGRGTTVDQVALIEALEEGQIAGAALDVMDPEPLPSDSPLWDARNVLITPHVAGYRAHGGPDLVAGNLEALRAGTALKNVVAR